MKLKLKSLLALSAVALATQAMAQITFYESENFDGRSFTSNQQVDDFRRIGFNDRASSVVVRDGAWVVCQDVGLNGNCRVLQRGNYGSLRELGLDNRVSSTWPLDSNGHYASQMPAPTPQPDQDYRRRNNERLYEARVTSVHAVVGPPNERCWIERQYVADPGRNDPNVGGAIAGAIIGGILGHQVGGGTGKDIATAGGVMAGAVIGSKAGQNDNRGSARDVRRCETMPSGPPQYWDVTYEFRGVENRMQMTSPPGKTISVNRQGEPRQ